MSKALIAIVGPSGSGKSTSLRNVDPATTIILDGERKGFPFPGSSKFRIQPFTNIGEYNQKLTAAIQDPSCKLVIVESLTKYCEYLLAMCQNQYKGYDIYGNYGKLLRAMLNLAKNDNKPVVFTAIDDIVDIPQTDGSSVAQRMIAVHGKEMRGKIEKEMLMVLFTQPRRNPSGGMLYQFLTNTDGICVAKTPMLMFPDQLVPNDLAAVLKRAKEYYNGEGDSI